MIYHSLLNIIAVHRPLHRYFAASFLVIHNDEKSMNVIKARQAWKALSQQREMGLRRREFSVAMG